jgi:hypothetical protein
MAERFRASFAIDLRRIQFCQDYVPSEKKQIGQKKRGRDVVRCEVCHQMKEWSL